MKMSDFEKAYAMFLAKTSIRKEKSSKAFESLIRHLVKAHNDLDKDADLPAEFSVKRTTRRGQWIKQGYCVKTVNDLTLLLTEKTINVLKGLIEEFEMFCDELKEYYELQARYVEALKQHIEELKKIQENLPQIVREAVQEGIRSANDIK